MLQSFEAWRRTDFRIQGFSYYIFKDWRDVALGIFDDKLDVMHERYLGNKDVIAS